jgi:basic amino acid/polyamine antiporter, APA family
VRARHRDEGLVRALGPWGLAAGAVSMIIGAGIFAVPAALAASLGPYGPLSLLACGIAVGAVAVCFAEGATRVPTSGGVCGFIEAAFGPLAGYVTGTLFWVGCVLACGGIAAALADVVVTLLPAAFAAAARAAIVVCSLAAIAAVNISGVARAGRLVTVTTAVKLLPLLLFVACGVGAMHRSNFAQLTQPDSQQLGRALILGLFAYVGMETPLCAGGEVRDPSRTIPRALLVTMLLTTGLYVSIQSVAQGILGPALAASKAPLADAMARIHPLLSATMLVGAAISMFGYLGSDILGSPRQLFAFARDGLMPAFLGRLHPRTHAPYLAIASYTLIAMVLALTGTFAELAVLSTLAIAPIYVGGCAAAWVLAQRGVAVAGPQVRFRFLGTAAAIGMTSMLAIIALGTRQEILGLAGLITLSVLAYYARARSTVAAT